MIIYKGKFFRYTEKPFRMMSSTDRHRRDHNFYTFIKDNPYPRLIYGYFLYDDPRNIFVYQYVNKNGKKMRYTTWARQNKCRISDFYIPNNIDEYFKITDINEALFTWKKLIDLESSKD